jgi:ureidoglycolate hydrolase
LERAAQRVTRKAFQTFGEMVDSEQEQTQSTQEVYNGGGIH